MTVLFCAGGCPRLISVSAVPGGNPVALADPENWAVNYMECATCRSSWCDRCYADLGSDSCPTCQQKFAQHYITEAAHRQSADLLAEAVMDRLRRHADTGDASIVLEPEALLEVRALLEQATSGYPFMVASYSAGMLHWVRYKALPPGEGGEDLAATLRHFAASERAAVRLIPDPDQRPKVPETIRLILERRAHE